MKKFRIDGLRLQRIGPFENIDLNFREKSNPEKADIHIFTGENGTGKTTLLQCLSLLLHENFPIIQKKLRPTEIEISVIDISISDKNRMLMETTNTPSTRFYAGAYHNDYVVKRGNLVEPFDYAFFAYSCYRRTSNSWITSVQDLVTNPLDNAFNFEKSIDHGLLIHWIANVKAKEAISKVKGDTLRSEEYSESLRKIEHAISTIIDRKIEFSLEPSPFRVVVTVDGLNLDFDSLPDGLKSIISWIGDLIMRMDRLNWENNVNIFDRNFILLLDEIEVHLHPNWQRKILPVIQNLFKNAQIFISTHSPFVVGSVDDAWIYQFKNLPGKGSILAEGHPVRSEDGKSYDQVLLEIFGIDKRFGLETEIKLDDFYRLQKLFIQGEENVEAELIKIANQLVGQSQELDAIISFELRQINKITGKNIILNNEEV